MGSRGEAPVEGLGDEVPQKLKLFCETTHNSCIKIQQTTVAVTRVDILNDITSKILGGHYHGCPLFINIGGTCPPVHWDRRPCRINLFMVSSRLCGAVEVQIEYHAIDWWLACFLCEVRHTHTACDKMTAVLTVFRCAAAVLLCLQRAVTSAEACSTKSLRVSAPWRENVMVRSCRHSLQLAVTL